MLPYTGLLPLHDGGQNVMFELNLELTLPHITPSFHPYTMEGQSWRYVRKQSQTDCLKDCTGKMVHLLEQNKI